MSTIEITRIEDLREGDFVTLRWGKSEGATVTVEGPMRSWAVRSAITDERFVSATREVPEWEPGTAGTATVAVDAEVMTSGWLPGVHLFRVDAGWRDVDDRFYTDGQVRDFVPDDIEALRRSLEVAREGYRKEAADWRARDMRMGAEVDRLEAEVERLRLVVVKCREEVERLRAARQAPTRKQIVGAMWPGAPESARAGMTHLDIVDRILALIEQGDES